MDVRKNMDLPIVVGIKANCNREGRFSFTLQRGVAVVVGVT